LKVECTRKSAIVYLKGRSGKKRVLWGGGGGGGGGGGKGWGGLCGGVWVAGGDALHFPGTTVRPGWLCLGRWAYFLRSSEEGK